MKINYTVPGYRPIIDMAYKYNLQQFLSFISTEDTGGTNIGIPYLSKYSDPFENDDIFPIALPLFMSKFFGSINEVERHKKAR